MNAQPSPAGSGAIATGRPRPGKSAPLAIKVEDLHKEFRIPTQRVDTMKERVVKPFAGREYRSLRALDGISFDIRQGEFFGIVGRNGSGKSTLLKILASIYRADSGRIEMAGRLAPFIELGVGFNAELTARENVVLNGVMMGLTPQESRERLGAVLEFAELEEFVDLKLKNYSSGMLVRLAFSVMLQADADIMLIDEVLAVGDAAFQQKCADSFHEMRESGKTIVLVTHEMATVEEYCDRAMLIDGGNILEHGDPERVGRRYLKLNFESGSVVASADTRALEEDRLARLSDIWLEDDKGGRAENVEQGEPIRLRCELILDRRLEGPSTGFVLTDANGFGLTQTGTVIGELAEPSEEQGEVKVTVAVEFQNPLNPGRYFVHFGVSDRHKRTALYVERALAFVIFGTKGEGVLSLSPQFEVTVDGEGR